jgi:hypothetical protein
VAFALEMPLIEQAAVSCRSFHLALRIQVVMARMWTRRPRMREIEEVWLIRLRMEFDAVSWVVEALRLTDCQELLVRILEIEETSPLFVIGTIFVKGGRHQTRLDFR